MAKSSRGSRVTLLCCRSILISPTSTLFTGATQTSWSQQNASTTYRAVITVVLIGVFAAGAARVQFSKLPKVMG